MSTRIDKRIAVRLTQYNGITISTQKAHTDCRVLRNHSGAIQAYQTSKYGNP